MRDLDWCIEHPFSAAPMSRRELTEEFLLALGRGRDLKLKVEGLEAQLERLKKKDGDLGTFVALDRERLDRLETALAKTSEALGYKIEQLTEEIEAHGEVASGHTLAVDQTIAEHIAIDHEGLNQGLFRDLIAHGVDHWAAVAILRNNKDKAK